MEVVDYIQLPCGQTYFIRLEDGSLLEAGDVFMSVEKSLGSRPYAFADFDNPGDDNKRVMTICTMVGCCCHCNFCASKNTFKRLLTADEIVGQVDLMIKEGVKHGRLGDLSKAKELRVLYTRMGEPMLNAENVIESIKILIKRYPNIIIGMSTSGYRVGLDKFLQNPEIIKNIDMQFSLHSTNDQERDELFGTKTGVQNLNISQIAEYVKKWKKYTNKQVSLNMILFDNYEYDIKKIYELFGNKDIWLRLSPWNVVDSEKENFKGILNVEDCISKKPITSQRLKDIISEIEKYGISYAYAPAIDQEIKYNVACGQALEAYKKRHN